MRHLAGIISIALTFAASAATLQNGDFAKGKDGRPEGWEALGTGVSLKSAGSLWTRTETVFNIADYKTVRIHLGVHRGAGTVWFDNVRVEESEFAPLTITNKSFEEGDAKTLPGWGQDAPGERTFRDTSVWTRFPGQGFGSGASARVTSPDGKPTRMWQDVAIVGRGEPDVDYVLSVAWRAEDLQGEPLFEVSGLKPGRAPDRALPGRRLPVPFPPEQFGKHIVELSLPRAGASGVSQHLNLSPADRKRAWGVSAWVRIPQLRNGSVALSVHSDANFEPEAVERMAEADGNWRVISTNFIPGDTDPWVVIRLKAAGVGPNWPAALVHVDNVRIGPPSIIPAPERVEWLPLDQSFLIPRKLTVGMKGAPGAVIVSAARLFSESLEEKTGGVAQLGGPLSAEQRGVELVVAPEDGTEREPESYSLRVSRDRVTLVSADERGALYGLLTLAELIQRTPTGAHVFLAASIDDAPDLPFRGIYWAGGDRQLMDRFARLRYNAVLIENLPYASLADAQTCDHIRESLTTIAAWGSNRSRSCRASATLTLSCARIPMLSRATRYAARSWCSPAPNRWLWRSGT